MDVNNQKRILASQIILDLYNAHDVEQLKLLEMQIKRSIEVLKEIGECES